MFARFSVVAGDGVPPRRRDIRALRSVPMTEEGNWTCPASNYAGLLPPRSAALPEAQPRINAKP